MEYVKTREEVLALFEASRSGPVFLLKHSTRCPVSAWALTEFGMADRELSGKARFAVLDLIAHRDTSNFIAEHTGIRHESPQVFFLKDGQTRESATHESVKATTLAAWLVGSKA